MELNFEIFINYSYTTLKLSIWSQDFPSRFLLSRLLFFDSMIKRIHFWKGTSYEDNPLNHPTCTSTEVKTGRCTLYFLYFHHIKSATNNYCSSILFFNTNQANQRWNSFHLFLYYASLSDAPPRTEYYLWHFLPPKKVVLLNRFFVLFHVVASSPCSKHQPTEKYANNADLLLALP